MLLSLDDEGINTLLNNYYSAQKELEKSLMMLSIKTQGKLTLTEIYQMSFLERDLYIECHNEFVDEQNKKNNA